MKKIFFLLGAMNVGGVEKAFLNMLPYLPADKYEIHLGLLSYKGGYLEDIPKNVHVHHIKCFQPYADLIKNPPLQEIRKMVFKGQLGKALIHTLLYIQYKVTLNRYWFYKYLLKDTADFPMKFDLAIAYAGPSQMIDYYICEKVHAKKKCGWIHFDIEKFGIDEGLTRQLYRKFNKIFLVSQMGKDKFDKHFPELKSKTTVFYNIVSPELIENLSQKAPTFTDNFTGKRLLTVGRVSIEKGQDYAVKALKLLVDKGYDVRWYFVGDGIFRPHCEQLARNLGVEDRIVFLGTQKNPYGFMKDCDVYVQPSRHEGYCITLAEARIFASPIVSTDFVGAREQLSTRANGFVTGFKETEMVQGIEKALKADKVHDVEKKDFHTDIDKLLSLLN